MGLFQKVEGDAAILSANGVYKQVDIYLRNGLVFAAYGGGFVKLFADGSTSKPTLRLDTLSADSIALHRTGTGVLCNQSVPKAIPLGLPEAQKLLGTG